MKIKKLYFIFMLASIPMIAMTPKIPDQNIASKDIILENRFLIPYSDTLSKVSLYVRIRDITNGENQNAPIIWDGFLSSRFGYTTTISVPSSVRHMRIRIADPKRRGKIITTEYLTVEDLCELKKTTIGGYISPQRVEMYLSLESSNNSTKIIPLNVNQSWKNSIVQ